MNPEFREDVKGKINSYDESWRESRMATLNLIEKTLRATAQPITTFIAVNNARTAIPCFLNAATKILSIIEQNRSTNFREKLKKSLMGGNEIQNDIDVKRTKFPQTVCTGRNCIKRTIKPDGNPHFEFKVCHDVCRLKNVVYGKMPQEALIDCQIFNVNNTCLVCGCSYIFHTHIFFDVKNVVTSRKTNKMTPEEAENYITNYMKMLQTMKRAIFSAFTTAYRYLHQNAILMFNESFEEQVNIEIRVQEANENPNHEIIRNLRQTIEDHKQMLNRLASIPIDQLNSDPVTDEEFASALNKVFNLPPLGKTIRDLYESERETAMEYNSDFPPLPVNFVPTI